MGTNTETFEVGSDIKQTSNKLERKRKREDKLEVLFCDLAKETKPPPRKKRKAPVQSAKRQQHAWHSTRKKIVL